jgi:hypothetical protein
MRLSMFRLTSCIDDVLIARALAKGTHARRQALAYVSRASCRLRGRSSLLMTYDHFGWLFRAF